MMTFEKAVSKTLRNLSKLLAEEAKTYAVSSENQSSACFLVAVTVKSQLRGESCILTLYVYHPTEIAQREATGRKGAA